MREKKETMRFTFPPIYAVNKKTKVRNDILQLLQPAVKDVETVAAVYNKSRIKGYLLKENDDDEGTLIITNSAKPPIWINKVIRIKENGFNGNKNGGIKGIADVIDVKHKFWIKHPALMEAPGLNANLGLRAKEVRNSWEKKFNFREEVKDKNGVIKEKGLRPPQLGAVYATLAHWAATDETATIVIPTGVGKTETMLSILVKKQCEKLLVVVPTDALREQIAEKFITLGILKTFGILAKNAHYPIVGILKHVFTRKSDVDQFFKQCNVIVTTMNIAGQSKKNIQERMASHCSHLFIDEAHHTEARTWKEFKEYFRQKNILQFTATPFRNDGKQLKGKVIFKYSLRKAQQEEYYVPINFVPVVEYKPKKWDEAIAKKAIEQLHLDLEKGYDHILMARVNSIKRAEEVFEIYHKLYLTIGKKYKENFKPVQIHTGIRSISERESIRRRILDKDPKEKARIIICVDMLGEGFDLPELKIAAFHDIRKSLPITVQLVGRFTRSKPGLPEQATVIANVANPEVDDELKDLYEQDADWNKLLPRVDQNINQRQAELRDYLEEFNQLPVDIPFQNVKPATSTVIYKTNGKTWKPEKFSRGFDNFKSYDKVYHSINPLRKTLVIVMGKKVPIKWGKIRKVYNWNWDLHILYCPDGNNLLFIHSSNTGSYYKKLAEAVAGKKVERVSGEDVFRCFHNIDRLKLNNVGLKEKIGTPIFTMRAGSDIGAVLKSVQLQNKAKVVLFGNGYEDGDKISLGCSLKGRIWSYKRTDILELTRWCDHIGKKVLDKSIEIDDILEGTLLLEKIDRRPDKMPIGIDWPEEFYKEMETKFSFHVQGRKEPFYPFEAEIKMIDPSETGDLKFAIRSGEVEIRLKLKLFGNKQKKGFRFVNLSETKVMIKYGRREKKLEEYFDENPPTILFVDGSSLEGNLYTELQKKVKSYDRTKIKVWEWEGIDLKKESQGITKRPDSIQYRVIHELKKKDYDVIFDDDDPGEAADVVAIKIKEGDSIEVEFYHCKFAHFQKKDKEQKPGARINDLYEVCGQAQKSIHWMVQPTEIFSHLLRREPEKEKDARVSRFERGTAQDLENIKKLSMKILPVKLSIYIVQPGLSRAKASNAQLELLGVTENHLMETMRLTFGVIASK
ncbi:MAG: DEAD/DEAH box helicase family protein [Candidatus Aminicenantes bacterium]|nr:MAG: DEAD/DEAH box helicase family protein [Candidatus Aminicenantes bacterium]